MTPQIILPVVLAVLAIQETSVIASPDSGGMVEMMDGLAYGGIPYGSVSGMLNPKIPRPRSSSSSGIGYRVHDEYAENEVLEPKFAPKLHQSSFSSDLTSMYLLPNMRAPKLDERSRGPVQIYRFPAVVGPNKLAMVSGMAY